MKRYATLARNVYSPDRVEGYVKGDKEHAVYMYQGEVIISFRGTKEFKDLVSDYHILMGTEEGNKRFKKAIVQARDAKALADRYRYRLVTTGHSLGGTLALYAGRAVGADRCYLYNPGMSVMTMLKHCSDRFCQDRVTVYTTGQDFVSILSVLSNGVDIKRVSKDEVMTPLSAHSVKNFTDYVVPFVSLLEEVGLIDVDRES
jgi:predicted alpha/beta-fold hydrolase